MRIVNLWFFIIISFASFTAQAANETCVQHRCVAIVDAGSSGSRLHIYSYDIDNAKSPVNITEVWSKKTKPGFASLEVSRPTVETYLTNLFLDAPVANLPTYFYATAGMRLLPQPTQEKFYGILRQWFANQSQWQLQDAKTITGKEEGFFGWLAVNYQIGSLFSRDKDLVGVMDMGGASVQISFPIQKTEKINPQDIQQFDLYGRHFKLFIHSFLGLGQNEMSHQFLDESSCFADNYQLPQNMPAAGNAPICAREISSLMNPVHKVNQVVRTAALNKENHTWFAIGGAAEVAKAKPFQFTTQFNSQDLLRIADSKICHQQWTILNKDYPNNDFLYGYCLLPAYYYALIVEGYGLYPQQPINLMGANQTNDWTVGVLLSQKQA